MKTVLKRNVVSTLFFNLVLKQEYLRSIAVDMHAAIVFLHISHASLSGNFGKR